MALTGQAKTDYQREYMRRRRSNNKANSNTQSVRPLQSKPIRPMKSKPDGLSANQWAYIQFKAEQKDNNVFDKKGKVVRGVGG